MRKLLNTLYVTNPDSYLARDGENVVVRMEERPAFRIPIHNLEAIITFGHAGASPALMHLCAERGVALSFHKESGQFLARVQGAVKGNVLLRRRQYKMADGTEAVGLARAFIFAKIANSRVVLNRGLRDHADEIKSETVSRESEFLKRYLGKIMKLTTLDDVRGLEGDAARRYFSAFDQLILVGKKDFFLRGRNRRPPLDRINAMLSYLYGVLRNDVTAALETVGLDPQVGFLHRDRPGRQSLSLDVMEELRAYLVDRLVLSLVNRKQVDAKQFLIKENGAVLLKPELKKELIAAWQKRKQEEITHPFLKEKISLGLLPYVQALLLARYVRGDLETYPPFLWR
ncbi:type I-C CRISPR-associated endonuclease Cas1c [Paenibacillus sp. MMS18-CY102]|uniref:type I-C CRISPR-associated endonuclease Cas1c n=1 Tax=Paenibacillus sp. MMS18-CY102 TaxID=2682849 RepID=UPI0013652E07|nr:type I-C CRISPR-associated endonuclease Cas1c [Paenibacillus sp. MMS18-CY102]MWC27858.1 type I-C CRISPR-associated endonuclease Cas1 [Paenibacillus sp. MMS18-CY102]